MCRQPRSPDQSCSNNLLSNEPCLASYKALNDPKQVFMEVDLGSFQFFDTKEGTVRQVKEKDIDQVVYLHRHLHNTHLPARNLTSYILPQAKSLQKI